MKASGIIVSYSVLMATAVYAIPIPKVHQIRTDTTDPNLAVVVSASEVKATSQKEVDKYRGDKLRFSIVTTTTAESDSAALNKITDPSEITSAGDQAGTTKTGQDGTASYSTTSTNGNGGGKTVTIYTGNTQSASETTTLTGAAAQEASNVIAAAGGTDELYVSQSVSGTTKTITLYGNDGKPKWTKTVQLDQQAPQKATSIDGAVGAQTSASSDLTDAAGNVLLHAGTSSKAAGVDDSGNVGANTVASGDTSSSNPGPPGPNQLNQGLTYTVGGSQSGARKQSGAPPTTSGSSSNTGQANVYTGPDPDNGYDRSNIASVGTSAGSGGTGKNSASIATSKGTQASGLDNVTADAKVNSYSQTGSGVNGHIGGSSLPQVSAQTKSTVKPGGTGIAGGEAAATASEGDGGISHAAGFSQNMEFGYNYTPSAATADSSTNDPKGTSSSTSAGSYSFGSGASNKSSASGRQGGTKNGPGTSSATANTSGSTTSGQNKQILPGAAATVAQSSSAIGKGTDSNTSAFVDGALSASTHGTYNNPGDSSNYSGAVSSTGGVSTDGGKTYAAAKANSGGGNHVHDSLNTSGGKPGGSAAGSTTSTKNTGIAGGFVGGDTYADGPASSVHSGGFGFLTGDPPQGSTDENSSTSTHSVVGTTVGGGKVKGNSGKSSIDSNTLTGGRHDVTETLQNKNTATGKGKNQALSDSVSNTPNLGENDNVFSSGGQRQTAQSSQSH